MAGKEITAVEFLADTAEMVRVIAINLQNNRLDRTGIQKLLHEYADRAKSDGQLINASRQSTTSIEHGLLLVYVHLEFMSWLADRNFTIPATAVKWYSWKQFIPKYRLSLFSISSQTRDLRILLGNLAEKADLVYTDLIVNKVMLRILFENTLLRAADLRGGI